MQQDNLADVPNVRQTDKLPFTSSSEDIASVCYNQSEPKSQNDGDKAAKRIGGDRDYGRSVSEENLSDGGVWSNSVSSSSTSRSDFLLDAGLLNEHTDSSQLLLLEVAEAALEPTYVREPVMTDISFNLPLLNIFEESGWPSET